MAINALGQVNMSGGTPVRKMENERRGSMVSECHSRHATPEGSEYYYQGNILKYVCRYREKGGSELLKKVRWYLE
ncbi:DUF3310 domain-containing protein [Selenomonas ruminantium]|uniref:DUF3310 domain-containing protein n=1 Tax=Selenomonas ruminantium TaxID=971 RepID=UPI0026EF1B4D|nr:DUF3310 domain-containing protein [Selenomonas ruminantium]